MELIYVVCFTSFLLGATSYIIARYWITPIWKYHRLRIRITETLAGLAPESADNLAAPAPDSSRKASADAMDSPLTNKALKIRVRKYAVALSDHYVLELPHWYRLVLFQRQEKCEDAVKEMMKLANLSDPVQVAGKIRLIRELLHLK